MSSTDWDHTYLSSRALHNCQKQVQAYHEDVLFSEGPNARGVMRRDIFAVGDGGYYWAIRGLPPISVAP